MSDQQTQYLDCDTMNSIMGDVVQEMLDDPDYTGSKNLWDAICGAKYDSAWPQHFAVDGGGTFATENEYRSACRVSLRKWLKKREWI